MNTASAIRTSDRRSPLMARAARKWYSWASTGLLGTALYLGIDGQLKLDGMNLLKAAPPSDIAWQANPEAPEELPAPKERQVIAMPDPVKLPATVHLPDVVEIPEEKAKPLAGAKLSDILNAYLKADEVTLAKYEEIPTPPTKLPLPPVPADRPPQLPSPAELKPIEPMAKEDKPVELTPIMPEPAAPKGELPLIVLPPSKLDVAAESASRKGRGRKTAGDRRPRAEVD